MSRTTAFIEKLEAMIWADVEAELEAIYREHGDGDLYSSSLTWEYLIEHLRERREAGQQ